MIETTPLVLVIEDHEEVATLAAYFLRRANYRPVVAMDGLEGLHLSRTLSPALVLCDLGLPKLNGWELLAVLRSNPATERIPFALMSGLRVARCGSPMPDAFLCKPFRREELLATVRALIHRPLGVLPPGQSVYAGPVLDGAHWKN